MKTRRRKKFTTGKCIIFLGLIVFMNLMGITYAYWSNGGMDIITMVNTGIMEIQFDPYTKYETVNGNGELTVRYLDERTVLIEGTVEEGVDEEVTETDEATVISPVYSDYEGIIEFKIVNSGRVPAKLVDVNMKSGDEDVVSSSSGYSGPLYPVNYGTANDMNQVFYIRAGAEEGTGTIEFETELTFNQLN